MRTIISHFYNEEYLLPFWLRHHREMFDHGVLIDYASTDASCDIIRELAPDWEIIRSRNQEFDAIELDMEIMEHERRFDGWKICLNITEFLCAENLGALEASLEADGMYGTLCRGVIMVDPLKTSLPPVEPALSLIEQRHFGYYEDRVRLIDKIRRPKKLRGLRSRLYHRFEHGAYCNGRHTSHRSVANASYMRPYADDLLCLWYNHSPWNDAMKARKIAIGDRIPKIERDKETGKNWHIFTNEMIEKEYAKRAKRARDLSKEAVFRANTRGFVGDTS